MEKILIIKEVNNQTLVITDDKEEIIVNEKPLKLIEKLCLINGSSLQGRTESFKYLTNTTQKACILIKDNILLMPTLSMYNSECVYILYNKVVWVKQDEHKTMVLFNNGFKASIDCGHRTIRKQLKRCDEFYEKLYKNRRNNIFSISI